jgi:hypothetical protein
MAPHLHPHLVPQSMLDFAKHWQTLLDDEEAQYIVLKAN